MDLEKALIDEAINDLDKAIKLSNGREIIHAALGRAYFLSGRKKDALKILHDLASRQNDDPGAFFAAAILNASLGNKDEAIESLYNSYEDHFGLNVYLNVEPLLDPLRSEPKFIALLKKIGLEK